MKTFLLCNAVLLFFLMPTMVSGQLVILSGKVTNQKTGNILQSVSIVETNSGIGTISNAEGVYSLMLRPGNSELVITRQGFKEFVQEINLKNDTTVNVELVPLADLKSRQKNQDNRKTALATPKIK